jgi:3-dehydroquinate dehydratase/shikimate dehydrogenase
MALLCETVTADSMEGLIAARDAAVDADMVELRLDGVSGLDATAAVAGRRCPVVVTCRPLWEGGRFEGAEADRARILTSALEAGAEHVDVEWRTLGQAQGAAFGALIAKAPARIVVSAHDFAGVPADLDEQVGAMRATGAATIKVAVTPKRLTDTLPLAAIGAAGGAVVVGMGDAGVPSRLLAARYGSQWTYAGQGVAPGQIPAARMLGEFRFRQVGSQTRLFGVISTNAMHSASPAMHNAAFDAADLDAVYVPLRAADIADFKAYAEALGFDGASVTIPFKLDALRMAAFPSERAVVVGAANTLRRIGPPEGGPHKWEAANTDVEGFLAPLADAFGELRGARVAVLGAGGSARAIVAGLRSRDARITIHARRVGQAREVAELGGTVGPWPPAAGSWDLLVNTTPLGGAALRDQSPLPGGPFDGRLVYDLTYGPGTSALVREAQAAGCQTLDGLPMLVAQAERQFEWWTGVKPAEGVMQQAARIRLGIAS